MDSSTNKFPYKDFISNTPAVYEITHFDILNVLPVSSFATLLFKVSQTMRDAAWESLCLFVYFENAERQSFLK